MTGLTVRKIFTLFLLGSVVLSCSSSNRPEGWLCLRLASAPSTLDPAYITDVDGGVVAAKMFNGLVRLLPDMSAAPDLASSYTISDDGLTYTFKLRSDAVFSSGAPVTSADFDFSFHRLLDKRSASPNTWVLDSLLGAEEFMEGRADRISGIGTPDVHTLVLRLKTPFKPFIHMLTMTAAYVVPEREVLKKGESFGTSPVGTGPYVLHNWRRGSEIRLQKNDSYFGEKALVKGIFYRVIIEDLTAVAEFELGNLDAVGLPDSVYRRYAQNPKWKGFIEDSVGLNTYYLGLNCRKKPFDNPVMRRAVSHAIDTVKILDKLYEGRGERALGPVPPMLRKWPPPTPYAYDPTEAGRLLKEAGYRGQELLFYITAREVTADTAEVIQYYLKEAGLNVSIRQLEWSSYKAAVNNGEADMFWLSWWADYPEAENFLHPIFHSENAGPSGNRAWYVNPETDKYLDMARLERDTSMSDLLYSKAEALVVRDAPWVFFFHKSEHVLRQPYVKGYNIYPVYTIDKGIGIEI